VPIINSDVDVPQSPFTLTNCFKTYFTSTRSRACSITSSMWSGVKAHRMFLANHDVAARAHGAGNHRPIAAARLNGSLSSDPDAAAEMFFFLCEVVMRVDALQLQGGYLLALRIPCASPPPARGPSSRCDCAARIVAPRSDRAVWLQMPGGPAADTRGRGREGARPLNAQSSWTTLM
jgi:hypothetical protein